MERFGGINFQKRRYSYAAGVNTSRKVSFGGFFNRGDEIFYDPDTPFLGRNTGGRIFSRFARPHASRRRSTSTRAGSPTPRNNDEEVFDVKIFRGLTTYQFTERLLFRNIAEFNTLDKAIGLNFLFTYRVNSGTVFYLGYDDHYQRADRLFAEDADINGDGIPDPFYQPDEYKQTNRAIFMKFSICSGTDGFRDQRVMCRQPCVAILAVALTGTGLTGTEDAPLEKLTLPPGFRIEVYASDVENARQMALSPDGTLFVSTRQAGNVYAVLDEDGDQKADRVITVASGLRMPNGVAFHDGDLYVPVGAPCNACDRTDEDPRSRRSFV